MHDIKIRDLIKSILQKKAVKNGIWMYLLQIFNTVVPLLTLPYITRILGATQYGIFSIAINLVGYYQVVVEYGFGMSATRKVALAEKKNYILNKTFTSVLIARCFLLAICFFITVVYILLNNSEIIQCICLLILMITLLGNCIQLNWLFQGMQQMQYISIISMVARIISVILIFLLVKRPDDLFLYCLLYSVSPLISGILGLYFARKAFGLKVTVVTKDDVWNELKAGWYVFTTQLSSKVFGAIGITFLGMFASSKEVGIYSAIQKIPNIIILAWTPITQVMYPISSQKIQESFITGMNFIKKMKRIFLPLFMLVACVCAMFSKIIVLIAFGKEYVEFFYWMLPLLIWMVISINNNFMGIQTLLAGGYDKEYGKCFQIGVVVTILLNFVLVYFFKGNGACLCPLLSEVFLGLLLKREVKILEKVKIKS